jgi:hypothetical protein
MSYIISMGMRQWQAGMSNAESNTAHCRRRKIRCLFTKGGPQQSCENCIRLRKECIMCTVGQQDIFERSISSPDAGTRSLWSLTNPASFPALGMAKFSDRFHQLGNSPSLLSDVSAGLPGSSLGPGGHLPGRRNCVPGVPVYGMFIHDTGTMPSLSFQRTSSDGHTHREPSGDFGWVSQGSIDRMNEPFQSTSHWTSSSTAPPRDFAPVTDAGSEMPLPVHYRTLTSCHPSNPHIWHLSQKAQSISYDHGQHARQVGHIAPSSGFQPSPSQEQLAKTVTCPPVIMNYTTTQGSVSVPQSVLATTPEMPTSNWHPFIFEPQMAGSTFPLSNQQHLRPCAIKYSPLTNAFSERSERHPKQANLYE